LFEALKNSFIVDLNCMLPFFLNNTSHILCFIIGKLCHKWETTQDIFLSMNKNKWTL